MSSLYALRLVSTAMKADRNLLAAPDSFEQIFSITPLPMLMLGEDGVVLGASDEGPGRAVAVGVTAQPGLTVRLLRLPRPCIVARIEVDEL